MTRGQQDFGPYAPVEVAASLSDMGELAARLGSIVTFDKRGNVVAFDDFEEPVLRWVDTVQGAADYVRLDSASVKSGSQAVKIHADDAAVAWGRIHRGFALLGSLSIGIEISFSKPPDDPLLYFRIYRYSGTEEIRAELRLDFYNQILEILNSSGAYETALSSGQLASFYYTNHTVKLVADFDAKYYKRVLLDSTEVDLSDKECFHQAYSVAAHAMVLAQLQSNNSLGGDIWLDDFILTQAEP